MEQTWKELCSVALAACCCSFFGASASADRFKVDKMADDFNRQSAALSYQTRIALRGCSTRGAPRICWYSAGDGVSFTVKSGHENLTAAYDVAVEAESGAIQSLAGRRTWEQTINAAIALFEPSISGTARDAAIARLLPAEVATGSTETVMLNGLRVTRTTRSDGRSVTDITRREPYMKAVELGLRAKELSGKSVRITDCLVMMATVSGAFCPIVTKSGVAGVISVDFADNDGSGRRTAIDRCAGNEPRRECLAAVSGIVNAEIRSLVTLEEATVHWAK